MRLLKPFLILLVFVPSLAYSQYGHLLHKPYSQKVAGVHAMYQDLIDMNDWSAMVQKADEIRHFARVNKDKALELNVDFFLLYSKWSYLSQSKEVSLQNLKRFFESVGEENIDFLRARSLRALAEFYWKAQGNFEQAFEQYLLLDKELQKTRPEDYPEMARDLMQIGTAYYFFQDYKVAIEYLKKAIVMPETPFTAHVINDARNTLGMCYQQLNDLDSSDYYLKKVFKTTFPQARVWKRIVTGNLGANAYRRGDYDRAIGLLQTDFNGSVVENDFGCAASSSILLADIFRIKGDFKQSAAFVAHAQHYIAKAEQPERLRLLYPVMSKLYVATGNKQLSVQYMDSSTVAIARFNDKFSALKVLRAQQRVERQTRELQQAGYALERQQKIAERNLLALLVLILCIGIALTYFIQKKQQLAKDLKLQAANQELKIAAYDLDRFTEKIREKNHLIEQLESRSPDADRADIFRELHQSTILTEDDWQSFQLLFDKVHPGFITRVRENYQGLSIGELRYFVLCRLNLSTKEMAAMLGVSSNAILVMRHRIRKRLNIADGVSLEEMIRNS